MISKALRKKIRDGNHGRCWYCHRRTGSKLPGHVDHILLKSKSGPDQEWNLVWACCRCNWTKRDHLMPKLGVNSIAALSEWIEQFHTPHDRAVAIARAIA